MNHSHAARTVSEPGNGVERRRVERRRFAAHGAERPGVASGGPGVPRTVAPSLRPTEPPRRASVAACRQALLYGRTVHEEPLTQRSATALARAIRAGELTSREAVETHIEMCRRWQPRTGELADRLNRLPKYVVSSTLEDPEWNNSTVLNGDVVTQVSKLKRELGGEIVVPASHQLGRTLIQHDLVDELRLVIFPVVLGAGERLFGETNDKKPMRLIDAKTLGDGLAYLAYEFVRKASVGEHQQPLITHRSQR